MQPTAEHDFGGKHFGLACDIQKNGLGNVLGQVGIPSD